MPVQGFEPWFSRPQREVLTTRRYELNAPTGNRTRISTLATLYSDRWTIGAWLITGPSGIWTHDPRICNPLLCHWAIDPFYVCTWTDRGSKKFSLPKTVNLDLCWPQSLCGANITPNSGKSSRASWLRSVTEPFLSQSHQHCWHLISFFVCIGKKNWEQKTDSIHGRYRLAVVAQLGERQTEDLKVPGWS